MPNALEMIEEAARRAYPVTTGFRAQDSETRIASAEAIAAERMRVANEGQLRSLLRSLNAELARYYATGDKQALQDWKEKQQAVNALLGFQTRLETQRMGDAESWEEAKLRAKVAATTLAAKASAAGDSDIAAARRSVDGAIRQATSEFANDVRTPELDGKIQRRAGAILGTGLSGAYDDPDHIAQLIIQEASDRGITVSASPAEKAQAAAAEGARKKGHDEAAAGYVALGAKIAALPAAPGGSPLYGQLANDIKNLKDVQADASPVSAETQSDIEELERQREQVKGQLGMTGQEAEGMAGPSQADEERFVAWSKARGYDIGFYGDDGQWVPGRDLGNAQLAFERQQTGERTPFMRGKPTGETELVQYQMPANMRTLWSTDDSGSVMYEARPDGSIIAHTQDGGQRIVRTMDGLYPDRSLRAAYEAAAEGAAPLNTADGKKEATAADLFTGNVAPVAPTFGEFHGVRQPPMAYDDVNTRRYKAPDGTEVIFRLNTEGKWVPDRAPKLMESQIAENKLVAPSRSVGDRFRKVVDTLRMRREKPPAAEAGPPVMPPAPAAPPAPTLTQEQQRDAEAKAEMAKRMTAVPAPSIDELMRRPVPTGPAPATTVQPVAAATAIPRITVPPPEPPTMPPETEREVQATPVAAPPPAAPPAAEPAKRKLSDVFRALAKKKKPATPAPEPPASAEDISFADAVATLEESTPRKGRAQGPVTGPPSKQELAAEPTPETAPESPRSRLLAALLKKRTVK